MPNKLFLIWKADTHKGEYIPIGTLEEKRKKFFFYYLTGIRRAQDLGYGLLPEFSDVDTVYKSSTLFPLFANRMMSRSRKTFQEYMGALNLDKSSGPLLELSRNGGKRATDRYRVFAPPEKKRNEFQWIFFVAGLTRSPMREQLDKRLEGIKPGTQLLLTPQIQNQHDSHAIMLHSCC